MTNQMAFLTACWQCNLQRMWCLTLFAKASICLCEPVKFDFVYSTLAYSKHCAHWWGGARRPKMSGFWWLLAISENTQGSGCLSMCTYPLPAVFCGLLLWNSISSTVHTAPFTFSKRTKHLWRLRLCLTAFWKIAEKNAGKFNVNATKRFHTLFLFYILLSKDAEYTKEFIPSKWLHCAWNMQSFLWTSCRFHLMSADCEVIQI